jgi:hypothetical protein
MMPVYRYLDLSTSHLSEREMQELLSPWALGDLDHSPRVIGHDYGSWVNVPALDGSWSEKDTAALERTRPNLAVCIARARALDCTWINFDADADAEPGLPTFDW